MFKKLHTYYLAAYILSISILFELSSPSTVKASTNRQIPKITIKASNIPLEQVFVKIREQTGLTVYNNYLETSLSGKKKVTVNFIQKDIREVMNFLLLDKKDLTFEVIDQSLHILKRSNIPNNNIQAKNSRDTTSSLYQLNGKIIDKDGNPIPGATIKLKNNNLHGAISAPDGSFTLSNIEKRSIIIVSSLGFESKEIVAANKSITIQLNPHLNQLDEKVIMAYGTTTKRLNTGNIGSLKAIDIENQPVNNPLSALQGRVPGIFIEQANGLPGSGISVRIQGQNSIRFGNDPYYVIDGVPYVSQLLPLNNPINGATNIPNGSPLTYMNIADIESIEVLKDADATAIYGSRAANGAVLITTKKGKSGPVNVSFTFQNGWAKVPKKMALLNTQQYLTMRHEALSNDKKTPSDFDWDLNGTWDTTRGKDWQKELIGKTAHYTDAQLSISGGNVFTQYLVGGGIHRETTVFPSSFEYKKGNVHLNLGSNSANQKFKFQFTSTYTFDDNKLPIRDITSAALTLSPVAPDLLNADGSINWMPNSGGSSTYFANPFIFLNQSSRNKTTNLITNAILGYEIIQGLTLKTSFGYNNLLSDEITKYPVSTTAPEYRQNLTNASQFLTNRNSSWIIEPQVEYQRKIAEGNITALVGGTISQQSSDQQNISADGFTNELTMEDLSSATRITATNINAIYKYNAIYARITSNWLNKYILNLSARRDGSSRFGPQNQFHNFGSIGAAWIFSQESFVQSLHFLSFGKLRASFGTTGNDQIGDYTYMDTYQTILTTGIPYQGIIGLSPSRLTNPYLQWEETKKLQIGIELGVLNDKILLSVNYNQNRSSNQLLEISIPSFTGFSSITENFPAIVQNTGWEFTFTSANIKTKNFNWTTNLNLTTPRNQLLSYFGMDRNTSINIGRSLNTRTYFRYAGINETTGNYQFYDEKGNITSTPSSPIDRISILNTDPKIYGGIQNTFSCKGFGLDIFFNFTKRSLTDNVSYGQNNLIYPGSFNGGKGNQSTNVLNRWQKPGDHATVRAYSAGKNINLSNIRNSDASITDGSYIRLKNISLSWQFPSELKRILHLQNGRLFINAQNIITFTKFKSLDPETGLALPPLRTIILGIQVTL